MCVKFCYMQICPSYFFIVVINENNYNQYIKINELLSYN